MLGIDLLSFYVGMAWGVGAAAIVALLWRRGS